MAHRVIFHSNILFQQTLKCVVSVKSSCAFQQKWYFQQMLKANIPMKSTQLLERSARESLHALLQEVPSLEIEDTGTNVSWFGEEVDILVHVRVNDRPYQLVCEVKPSGQPRHVRQVADQTHRRLAQLGHDARVVLLTPYLSPDAQQLCQREKLNYLDFEGNAHLELPGLFIDRRVATKPASIRRELKSLFKPKSAQVLRTLLKHPNRSWRVTELADIAKVSLGHVSNVRAGLLNREWAEVSKDGLNLSDPRGLLDAWQNAYEPNIEQRLTFYTAMHGKAFDAAVQSLFQSEANSGSVILSSFSAAKWLAPFARTGTHYFYADDLGWKRLRSALNMSPNEKGENVVVCVPKDDEVFVDASEPASGIRCTSALQTYLDLAHAGERGKEAADHLRRKLLPWTT